MTNTSGDRGLVGTGADVGVSNEPLKQSIICGVTDPILGHRALAFFFSFFEKRT